MREPRRPEPVLAEQVALASLAEDVRVRHAKVGNFDLAVVAAPRQRVDVAHDLPTVRRRVDQEGRVARLRRVCVGVGAGNEDGEAGAARPRDEPLVAVDNPVVAVLHRVRLDQRRVGAGDLGLGHGEAGAATAFGEGPEVLLGLLRRGPVDQGVHVAFVGGLRVQHVRPDAAHARRLRGDEGHRGRAEAHAVPLLRQVGVPDADLLGALPQLDDLLHEAAAVGLVALQALLDGANLFLHELAHLSAHFFYFRWQCEIDWHGCSSQRVFLASKADG